MGNCANYDQTKGTELTMQIRVLRTSPVSHRQSRVDPFDHAVFAHESSFADAGWGKRSMKSLMEEIEAIASDAGWSSESLLQAIAWWFENNKSAEGLIEHLHRLARAEATVRSAPAARSEPVK